MSRVLITGGGSGTGADMARAFHAAGHQVVIAGRRADALARVADGLPGVRCVVADVTDEASVAAMFASAGPCQIVIANAGSGESAPFAHTTLARFNTMIAVNLTGTFLTLRDGLRQMGPGGRLIAIASVAGLKGAPYVAAYAAAKHGVVGLVRSVALEVARKAITCNAICPGYIDTDMTAATLDNIIAKTGKTRTEALASLTATNPQGRLIAPCEISAMALWLCSDGAIGVNGQALAITGGEA
ncbi:MAG: SDR family oxidoreductase [Pseudomonadota bacterium]